MKDRLSKMRLLESLIAKKDPLAEYEEALKKKMYLVLSEVPLVMFEMKTHGVNVTAES
ncbi:hypothetical protein F2Q69_00008213 [Brassica cretica]|uniref:Uncharacterized protein n=1 Tax=Brassica cretica TaxID=69181 RepID=A0A8S9P8H1_BRACR|nr:hypothetical protein F2Q69_00008213 [Brassica cretica]